MKSETALQNEIRLAVGKRKDVRLFRNNVGLFKTQDGRNVQTGLCIGSSDLIGFQSITITPEMVGQKIAVFTAIEIKTPKGKPTHEQINFIECVRKFGGIAAIVKSVDDALAVLKS